MYTEWMRNHEFAIQSPVQSKPLAVTPPRSICKSHQSHGRGSGMETGMEGDMGMTYRLDRRHMNGRLPHHPSPTQEAGGWEARGHGRRGGPG